MTQEKMRRVITACVSAGTVLLVCLLCFLIGQWIQIGVKNRKIEKIESEIAALEQQIEMAKENAEFYASKPYLEWQLEELKLQQELMKD